MLAPLFLMLTVAWTIWGQLVTASGTLTLASNIWKFIDSTTGNILLLFLAIVITAVIVFKPDWISRLWKFEPITLESLQTRISALGIQKERIGDHEDRLRNHVDRISIAEEKVKFLHDQSKPYVLNVDKSTICRQVVVIYENYSLSLDGLEDLITFHFNITNTSSLTVKITLDTKGHITVNGYLLSAAPIIVNLHPTTVIDPGDPSNLMISIPVNSKFLKMLADLAESGTLFRGELDRIDIRIEATDDEIHWEHLGRLGLPEKIEFPIRPDRRLGV